MINIKKHIPFVSVKGESSIKKSIIYTVIRQIISMFCYTYSLVCVYLLIQDNHEIFSVIPITIFGIILLLIETKAIKLQFRSTNLPAYHEVEDVRLRLVSQLARLPLSFYNDKDMSEISGMMMSDCANLEHLIAGLLPEIYASAITFPLIFLVLAFLDLRLTLATLITVPIAYGIQICSLKLQASLVDQHKEVRYKALSRMQDYINGIQQIRADDQSNEKLRQLMDSLTELKKASLRMELTSGVFSAGAESILQSGIGIVIFFALHRYVGNSLSAFKTIVFFSASLRVYAPMGAQLTSLPSFIYFRRNLRRLSETLSAITQGGEEKTNLDCFDVEFKEVGFGYNDRPVLDGVDFSIKQGEITAIVGTSGAGKSTIANLLSRFWNPNIGEICMGGIDISSIDPEFYANYITFVFQDVALFHDTVYHNILVGRPDACREEVLAAARLARCDEFVNQLPNGYDTVLAENGLSLSGGERQRISIARAILKNAPIVVLDEATSSLDTMNEYYIHQALAELVNGRTVIVIAHTIRNIVNADKIIVLDNGHIIEQGTHEKLMQSKGLYEKMYKLQEQVANWQITNE